MTTFATRIRGKLVLGTALLWLAAASLSFCQGSTVAPKSQHSSTQLPAYEVVSIKPHQGVGGNGNLLWRTTPDGFSNSDISVEKLIRGAFHLIMAEQISGLPGWAYSDTFDVEAKMDEESAAAMQKLPRDERGRRMDLMMQALLSDRFQLRAHHETKVLPIYDLVIAKDGIKMKLAPVDAFTGWSMGDGHFEGKAVPIDSFIYNLSNDVGRLVVNQFQRFVEVC
jgi:uncharacterized protein (TIGR03435 family)